MIIKFALRNLKRNKRRTIITATAIGFGLACMMVYDGFMIGIVRTMVRSATETFSGEGQIHATGFRKNFEPSLTIPNGVAAARALRADNRVSRSASRAYGFAMITSPANVGAVSLVGISPTEERAVSKIDEAILKGAYLAPGDERGILIGKRLAKNLEVDIGDRLVVTVSQVGTGELSQEMVRVSGIFSFSTRQMDESMAFMFLGKVQQMLRIGDGIHEIAIDFHDPMIATTANHPFWKQYSTPEVEAVGWPIVFEQLQGVLKMTEGMTVYVGILLFAVVALAIVNTLLMSFYERIFEMGVLRAIGTRPRTMFGLIIVETGGLAVVGWIFGIALGTILMLILMKTGVRFEGYEMSGIALREPIYPAMRLYQYIVPPLWALFFTILAGIYPAIKAARLVPAKAMREGN